MADAAREWMARFERETGKTIRDGKVAYVDAVRALQVAVSTYARDHVHEADRVRVSSDVYRQLEAEILANKIFVGTRGKSVLTILGVVILDDPTLPEMAMVAERVV